MCDEQAPRPWLPSETRLPFFAYGLFKPGQLAYFQLRDLVQSTVAAKVPGRLLVRDGVPFLDLSKPHGSVSGAVVNFTPGREVEGYGRIAAMEPKDLYSWATILVGGGDANVLIGRSPTKGRPLDSPDWDGWTDPLFTDALDLIERRARALHGRLGYKALFERQMTYMLLWTSIERYLSVRYSLGGDIMRKIRKLAAEPGFQAALAKHVPARRDVRRSDRPVDAAKLDPEQPIKAALYYYQVRSNVTHRGKTSGEDDAHLLDDALRELVPIFREVLVAAEDDARRDHQSDV